MEKKFFIARHPESKIIFDLADMLKAAKYPIYFSFVDYGDSGEFDEEELEGCTEEQRRRIFWENCPLFIETQTGELIDGLEAPVAAYFNGDELTVALGGRGPREVKTAEEAFHIFKKFFESK